MKCPCCKKEITKVIVVSECEHFADLEGDKITDYGEIQQIGDTLRIECISCGEDIQLFVCEN